jgi:group I intron endonuclease
MTLAEIQPLMSPVRQAILAGKRIKQFGRWGNAHGVYAIVNERNGKFYVGSTGAQHGVGGRLSQHRTDLRGNYHGNPYLQSAWNKHGELAFYYVLIEQCAFDVVVEREQHYIDLLEAVDVGYNIRRIAGGGHGHKGESHFNAKLTDEIVLEMRRRYKAGGITYAELAAEFGPCAHPATTGRTWVHLNHIEAPCETGDCKGASNHNAKLTDAIVLEMRQRYKAGGVMLDELGAEFGVSWKTAHQAITGKTWSHLNHIEPPCNICRIAGRPPSQTGESNWCAKLTDEIVIEMRRRYKAGGITRRQLGTEFGVSKSVARYAITGKTWTHLNHIEPPCEIGDGMGESHHSAKLTDTIVLEMRCRYKAGGVMFAELAAEFGVGPSTARFAIIGKTWTHLNHIEPPVTKKPKK